MKSLVLAGCLLGLVVLALSGQMPSVTASELVPVARPAELFPQEAHITSTSTLTYYLHLPLILGGPPSNPQDRQQAKDLYLQQYLASDGIAIEWTGDRDTCNPGHTSFAFSQAVLRRINYYRTMAGVPGVTLSDEYSAKAQAAALMMSVNGKLDHSPSPAWSCYSSDGAEAAGSSNLALGTLGPEAINAYMLEGGPVGHRRWILYPQTQAMGTGDIPGGSSYWASNALWVFDSHMWEPRPETREEFVAWPPPGYVPYQVINDHWSFSYPAADFSSANVSMTSGGSNVSIVLGPLVNGYGENTLVWIPQGVTGGGAWPKPVADTAYTVKIQNAWINGQSRDYTYVVIVFDPSK